ncbi:outer membrane protein assembly factor BamA [Candidatus Pelagibacter sp.]|uniref:outer membrane protein assembly factor BamA n=1 Tax=Candidatus Pelagibacter sp. TaxID=2024849 RepID=UPI003F878435
MLLNYKKTILTTLLIFLLSLNNVYSDIIKKIEVKGNKRINTDTVEVFANIKVGSEVTENDLNQVLKNLYETNFFEDISLSINNSILTIKVVENPIIQNLIINGIKSKDFEKELRKRINIKEKSPFVENNVKSELEKIKNILQQSGYYFSKVNLKQRENNNETVDLVFDIDLGGKAFIKEIVFLGDKKFKKRQLINVIASEEDKFWKFISNKRLLDKNRIDLDKRLLESFYKNKGYYNVSISSESIQYQNNDEFKLVFNIDRGEKFSFGKVKINIPDDYDELYFSKIVERLNTFSNKIYSYKLIEKILDEIEIVVSSEQYDFVNASIDEKIVDDNKIDVSINIREEEVKSYVKKINILGNNVTIEDVVRNELEIDEGDPYNEVLFNKSISNIKSLNIFKTVNTEINDGDDNLEKNIDILVEEKPTGEIVLGAGVGTSGTSTSFGVKENNFLGKGIKLNSNLSLSENSIKGIFSYTKPHFRNSDRDLTLSAQSSETDNLKKFGYKTNDTGFLVGTRFEQLDDLFIAPNISMNYESIETSSTASSLVKKQEGSYFDVEGKYVIDYDKRDQRYQPTDGFLSSFSQKIPFNVGDNQTIVNSYEYTTYHEYLEDIVGSISFFGMNANSFGDEDVRISDRLYIPSRKLRGFEAGKVGPKDGGDYVGGNYVTALNVTTNLPIFQSLETMDFNLFYDAANVWGVDYSSNVDDSNKIRSSTGVALDWYTPIGPMSFSFSQHITKKSTDTTESFRFNLGTTF